MKRKAQKEKARRERIRLEKHKSRLEKVQSGPELPFPLDGEEDDFDDDDDDFPVTTAPRFAMERFFWEMQEAKGDREFENEEDFRVFMADLQETQSHLKASEESMNPKFRAQMVAFDGLELVDGEEASDLGRLALILDPRCVDALALVANDPRNSKQRRLAGLRSAIETAEEEMGPNFREKYKGMFWKDHVTRPYMRVLFDHAMALQENGKRAESFAAMRGMLEIDPDDSMGVRDILMGAYMLTGNREGQKALLDMFDDGLWGMFNWGRVFYEWNERNFEKASEALKRARAHNPHVEVYLIGLKPEPEHLPQGYAPGQPSEAEQIAFFTALAWLETPGIGSWLLREERPPSAREHVD